MRQRFILFSTAICLCSPAFAQAPVLPLPPLPAPGQDISNSPNVVNSATVPALEFNNLPGPESISNEEEETPSASSNALVNPTDFLPSELLPEPAEPSLAKKEDPPNKGEQKNKKNKGPLPDPLAEAEPPTTKAPETKDKPIKAAESSKAPTPKEKGQKESKPALLPPPPPSNVAAPLPLPIPKGQGLTLPPPPGSGPAPLFPADITNNKAKANEGLKSWEVPLKPARQYIKTRFNYRHVEMPANIYHAAHSPENQHLPIYRSDELLDSALLQAASNNNINGVRAALDRGGNIDKINRSGDTALILATKHGAVETARLLVARGANINHIGAGGKSAFFYASRARSPELVQLLSLRNQLEEKKKKHKKKKGKKS